MPKIPYESLGDSSDSLESTDEQGTSSKMDHTAPKETQSCCSATKDRNSNSPKISEVKTDDTDGESSHAHSLVRSPSESKVETMPQLRKKHRSETRINSFTLPAPPLTKQPTMNYFEAPASQWSRFIFDSTNFNFQSDVPTSSGAVPERERAGERSRFDRSQRRLRSGTRWDVGSSLIRQDTAQVIRRLRTRFNSMSRKQGLLEQINVQFSEEIKQIREELHNSQQSASEERDILKQQLIELQECVRQANVAEKQRDMLLSSMSELRDNVRALQQSFDRHIEDRSSSTRDLLIENNNLLNEMKTIQDENRQLHKALNAERSKLQRNRQILVRRNDHRFSLKTSQCRAQLQHRNNFGDKGIKSLPIKEFHEQSIQESNTPEREQQQNLPCENFAEIKKSTDHLPDVAIPLNGPSVSSDTDEEEHSGVRELNDESVPEHYFQNCIPGPKKFVAVCYHYKMSIIYTVIIILAIFLGTLIPVPWRM